MQYSYYQLHKFNIILTVLSAFSKEILLILYHINKL